MKLEIHGASAITTYTPQDLHREAQRVAKKWQAKLDSYAVQFNEPAGKISLAVKFKSGETVGVAI